MRTECAGDIKWPITTVDIYLILQSVARGDRIKARLLINIKDDRFRNVTTVASSIWKIINISKY